MCYAKMVTNSSNLKQTEVMESKTGPTVIHYAWVLYFNNKSVIMSVWVSDPFLGHFAWPVEIATGKPVEINYYH